MICLNTKRIFLILLVAVSMAQAMGPPGGGGGGGSQCDDTDTQSNACKNDGTDFSYTESFSGDLRLITTKHCPNHNWLTLNPNYPYNEGDKTYKIPTRPNLMTSVYTPLYQKGGAVGVLQNGAMIYSPYAGGDSLATDYTNDYSNSASALEGDTFDYSGQHGVRLLTSLVLFYNQHLPPPHTHTHTHTGSKRPSVLARSRSSFRASEPT